MNKRQAAVTGLGCICAAGTTVEQTMRSLYGGARNPAPPVLVKADIDKVSPVFEIYAGLGDEEAARNATRTTQMAIIAAREAIGQAGLDAATLKSARVGVIIGTTVGCTLNNEQFCRDYRLHQKPDASPVTRFMANNPALHLAGLFECGGPAVTVANACSSGTDAVGIAKNWIETGLCDIVIAGGSDELCRTTYIGFTCLMITSQEPCRPFDRNRKGLNLGEGAGVLIIENYESARNRGARALAFINGYGSSADAYHPTAPHPDGLGLRRATKMAMTEAGVTPDGVAFINAHGTSTVDNDKVEGKVIADLFPARMPVVSTKSYTGHTLGAAGAIEAIFTIKGLQDGRLPATLGFEEGDGVITPTVENTPITGTTAISNSLAFGGNNAVVVVGMEPA